MSAPKSLLFALFTCLAAFSCTADPAARPLKNKEDLRALTDSVMKLVVADKVSDAFEKLKSHWPLPGNEIDTLVLKTVALRNTVDARFGSSAGYSFVREDTVSDFLVRYIYAEKRDNHPLRWTFIFYKAKADWKVDAASWDDNVAGFFAQ